MPEIITPTAAGEAVPVVPATPGHLQAKWGALAIASLGALVNFLQTAAPQLSMLFPNKHWIGPAITTAGMAWYTVIHALDQSKVQNTNFTPVDNTKGPNT